MVAKKLRGFEGVVDILPLRIDSSYEPTIDACCKGEKSADRDGLLERRKADDCGDGALCRLKLVVKDLRG